MLKKARRISKMVWKVRFFLLSLIVPSLSVTKNVTSYFLN